MTVKNSLVFKDEQLQRKFDDMGFVRLNVLSQDETKRLLSSYEALPRPRESGFHCTMFSPEEDLRTSVDAIIKDALVDKLNAHFVQHTALYGNFMVKEPGVESEWFVHQDWAYVDETEHVSVAVWVPLIDLTEENGVLCVVPGSHKIPNIVRGPGVTDPWTDLHQIIKEDCHEKIILKAGEAIVWHHRLVHFSPPNLSSTARVAATLIYTPFDVPVIHYWKNSSIPGTMVNKYAIGSNFFMKYDIVNEPTEASFLGKSESDFPPISQDRLRSVCSQFTDRSLAKN